MRQHWIILTLCAVSTLGGCASVTQVKAGQHDRFRNALVESCRSIQNADFQAARGHLRQADSLAQNRQQAAKVDDLKMICSGAEALNAGEPRQAARAWLAVQNASLKNQLVVLADEEGINLVALAADHTQEEVRP